jgi:FkbM family methyltransferase
MTAERMADDRHRRPRFNRLEEILRRPDVRRHPLTALCRRLVWHIRWRIWPNKPWMLRLGAKHLKLEVPRRMGAAALIYYQGVSEPQVAAFILRFLRQGMTFYDIGAHLGEYTLLAANVVREGGQVHAFEPNPELAGAISRSVSRNGFEQCSVNALALGSAEGYGDLRIPGDPALGWVSAASGSDSDVVGTQGVYSHRVAMTTLDSYWSSRGCRPVHLIKMDIEGAELLALDGAEALLSQYPAPVLIFECLPDLLPRFGHGYAEVVHRLERLGYVLCEFAHPQFNWPVSSVVLRRVGESLSQPNMVATKDPDWLNERLGMIRPLVAAHT